MSMFKSFNPVPLSLMVMMFTGGSAQFSLAEESLAPAVPKNVAMAVMCWNPRTEIWVVGYLVSVHKDGSAIYSPPGGQLTATLGADGKLEPPKDRPMVADCFGKTIDELRAMGRVVEFPGIQ